MQFPDSFLDDIRDRLRISEVVGSRVTFDKKKTNAARGDYWACCPFHGEKTPSFHCEDRKGRYHCFGCGASGDHFRFLTELDGLSFPEAVERLADQAGLPMPVLDRRQQEREEKRKSLYDVMALAAKFFQDKLHEPVGAQARSYLRGRGLSAAVQKEFGIGFAPDSRNALKEHLAAQGIAKEQIEACGLVIHGDDIAVSYDRFRGRIMFPIEDTRGRVIAFGGRALAEDAMAKYLNSPETELFHKSDVLYNHARARKFAHDKGQLIVAEGYMDVIALHVAGFENAVAPLGTALTERQLSMVWRMQPEPVLCFDGDDAGLKAAYRVVDLALPMLQPGYSVRFAMLPEGKDPDDLLRDDGASAMEGVLSTALPLAEMLWNRETGSGQFDTPERRAELESRLRKLMHSIAEPGVRRHYGQDIAGRLRDYFGGGNDSAGTGDHRGQGFRGSAANRKTSGMRSRFSASPSLLSSRLVKKGHVGIPLRESVLSAGALYHPAICFEFFEEVSGLLFESREGRGLQSVILDGFANWTGEAEYPDVETLTGLVHSRQMGDVLEQMTAQLKSNGIWQMLPQAAFEDARDGWMQAYTLHIRNQTLNRELKTAERALADENSQENLERLLHIQQELARVDGIEALIEGFGVSSGRPSKSF